VSPRRRDGRGRLPEAGPGRRNGRDDREVGNLVCPALFDLGEAARVVVASVTDGDDKPAKYPYMFETADLVVLNKCDLLPYVPFDAERFETVLHEVNPHAPVLRLSTTRGDALPAWYRWIAERRADAILSV
jgi:hydrogenase nickel incorporation protein HypB